MKWIFSILLFIAFCFGNQNAFSQNEGPAVGSWRALYSYYQGTCMASDGTSIYVGTESGLFTYNLTDGDISAYSKANGMSDVGIQHIAYDATTGYTIVGYQNANIDLFKDGSFINLPDLMLSTIVGDKSINNIIANNGYAYISTGIGLVVINLTAHEVKETIQFYNNQSSAVIYASAIHNNIILVATSTGIFKSAVNNPFIQNYQTWSLIDNHKYTKMITSGNNIFLADSEHLYLLSTNDIIQSLLANSQITNLSNGANSCVWMCTDNGSNMANNGGKLVDAIGQIVDSFTGTVHPQQACQPNDVNIYFVDNYNNPNWGGLRKVSSLGNSINLTPIGPVTNSFQDINVRNGEIWAAHGSIDLDWNYKYNYSTFSHYKEGSWFNFADEVNSITPTNAVTSDFIRILRDPFNNSVYAAAYRGGLFELKPNDSLINYRYGFIQNDPGDTTSYRLSGLALDDNGNLWMTNYHAPKELKVKTSDGNWYSYHTPANVSNAAADLVLDDGGEIWYVVPGNGVVVYNTNNTLDNTLDDQSRLLKKGTGVGNLSDNNILCIAKDKDDAIWLGTQNGITIISCPELVLQNQCEGELRVVQYPGQTSAGYLFMDQTITAIAVDGANRKWIGTTAGTWLISDDAEKVLYHFTADNSPLPSDNIYRINIDPITGDVYFSTSKGLVVYRSTATEGNDNNESPLLIYPNPVPAGYNGQIAIRGLADNADVRITDISGQLVYRTTANGGQAVWNGSDYTGHKVQSGVYLVFVVSKDGTQKTIGKMIVNH